ncbi:MAG: hypothetical protein HUU10_15130 [Bacteroidetes bacterium]|nr:hypothetical protein [Bacteroidota bacterium]
MFDWIKGQLGTLIEKTGEAIDRNVTSDEERLKAKAELQSIVNSHIQKLEEETTKRMGLQAEEMQSARQMYLQNSSLQKAYALTFLIGYILLSVALILMFLGKAQLPSEGIAMISTIFGAMSTKVSTITDFLFGSSLGSKMKDSKSGSAT